MQLRGPLPAMSCASLCFLALALPRLADGREPSSRIFGLGPTADANAPFVDVAEAPDGAVIAALAGGRAAVIRMTSRGERTTLARYGNDLGIGRMGVAVASDGSVLVAAGWPSVIQRIPPEGSPTTIAGTGRPGFVGEAGRATAMPLDMSQSTGMAGIATLPGGALLFSDVDNNRVRRVGTDGALQTVAGSGPVPFYDVENSFAGDGGPATAALLFMPDDVLPLRGGGFLVSDTWNGRVRRVDPNGIITTFAGAGDTMEWLPGKGDGGSARRASLFPAGLAQVAGRTYAIGDGARVRIVGRDGKIDTFVNLEPLMRGGTRIGDFAGRTANYVEGLAVTAEGGLLIAAGDLYYRAPSDTARTLVRLRDARVSSRRVAVEFDATQGGRVRLEVRRAGRVVARAAGVIRSGRRRLSAQGQFPAVMHDVRLKLTSRTGARAVDEVSLFTSRALPSLRRAHGLDDVPSVLFEGDSDYVDRCRRWTDRRIDCSIGVIGEEDVCGAGAILLAPSGAVFARAYFCSSLKRPFKRRPQWYGPAWAVPRDYLAG